MPTDTVPVREARPPRAERGPQATRSIAPTALRLSIVVALAALALLPIANWIPRGHDAPWYAVVLSGWMSGTAIALGVGIVLAIASRRIDGLWRPGLFDGVIDRWARHPVLATTVIGVAALILYAVVALHVFSGRPLSIDEMVQMLQAQIFASGALTRPAAPHPEFFSSLHVVDSQGRVYSQFPAGGPAMLLLGVLVHAPWIIGPLCGAVAVVVFAIYVRRTEPQPGTALAATLLFAFAPFAVFMSGSHMNHAPTLMWTMIGVAAMAGVMASDAPRPWLATLSGLGFGMAATIRPVDAIAFALPAGAWYLARAVREPRRWLDAIPAGLGVALPISALLWVNLQTTGDPLLFGYEALWGKSHALGFHAAPWGDVHTPTRGLELVNLYLLRLQTYFLETPIPALMPALGALALTRRFDRFDRYLLSASALLVGLYFCYWFDGFYLGPRFMYLLLAVLALETARFLPRLRDRLGHGLVYRTAVYTAVVAVVMAVAVDAPMRARRYRTGLLTARWDADSAAAAAGVRNALVFVRESWGAQLIARMWGLGVSRSETDLLYQKVDACVLDQAIERLERTGLRDSAAARALRPLLRDSARVVDSPVSPDATEQYLPGTHYSPRCIARITEDRSGFTLFTPLLLAHGGGNVYARDLHERDTLLLSAYPERPLYLLKPATAEIGEPPRFYPLSRDSLERAWRDTTP